MYSIITLCKCWTLDRRVIDLTLPQATLPGFHHLLFPDTHLETVGRPLGFWHLFLPQLSTFVLTFYVLNLLYLCRGPLCLCSLLPTDGRHCVYQWHGLLLPEKDSHPPSYYLVHEHQEKWRIEDHQGWSHWVLMHWYGALESNFQGPRCFFCHCVESYLSEGRERWDWFCEKHCPILGQEAMNFNWILLTQQSSLKILSCWSSMWLGSPMTTCKWSPALRWMLSGSSRLLNLTQNRLLRLLPPTESMFSAKSSFQLTLETDDAMNACNEASVKLMIDKCRCVGEAGENKEVVKTIMVISFLSAFILVYQSFGCCSSNFPMLLFVGF